MSAPLRWTAVLAVVGALGFATGRYFGQNENAYPQALTFPVVSTDGSAHPASTPTAVAPRQVPGTLRDIMRMHGDFTQSAALHVLAANSDRKAIERLLKEAESIDRGSERRAAASILYQRYAELDPEAAIEHMMRRDSELDLNWLYAVFYSWAREDLDGAIARAAKLDDRNRAMAGNAIVRSRDDLPTEEREALGSKLDLQISVRDASTTDLRSPKAAERSWQNALGISDRDARQNELFTVAREWVRQDPQAAIRAIESLQNRSEREQLLQHSVQAWAEKNPREAVDWVVARPRSLPRAQLLAQALGAFVMKEPAAAMAMLERLPPGEREQMLPQVVMYWAHADPQASAAWLEKHDDLPMYQTALAMAASVYAARDPDEALRWAASLPGEDGQTVMIQVIGQIAQDDPERAAGMIGQLNEGPHRENAAMSIAQTWAQWDPRAALSWVEKQSRSDATPQLYRAVYGQWAVYEPEAAVSQLNFILESETRNAAILGMLESPIVDADLVDRLFQRLEGADARRLAAEQLYYRLRETDPQAAEQYRRAAGIIEGNEGTIIVN